VILSRRRRNGQLATLEGDVDSAVDPQDEARLKEAMKEMDEAEEPAF